MLVTFPNFLVVSQIHKFRRSMLKAGVLHVATMLANWLRKIRQKYLLEGRSREIRGEIEEKIIILIWKGSRTLEWVKQPYELLNHYWHFLSKFNTSCPSLSFIWNLLSSWEEIFTVENIMRFKTEKIHS